MPRHILFVIDPIDTLLPHSDTSILLMRVSLAQTDEVFVCQLNDLYIDCAKGKAYVKKISAIDAGVKPWYQISKEEHVVLNTFDAIIMRKDPPFDTDYLNATHVLELAEKSGVRVSNSPRALRDFNEKLSIFNFPELIAPTLVTSHASLIREFLQAQNEIILKPLDGMRGKDVFRIGKNDVNIDTVIEVLTHEEKTLIMAQRYIADIVQGDKRIWMIGGKAYPIMLVRIPQHNATRANIARGAKGELRPLGPVEEKITTAVGPFLKAHGIHFAGLDVIGDYLTEINITSPTGLRLLEPIGKSEEAASQILQAIFSIAQPAL